MTQPPDWAWQIPNVPLHSAGTPANQLSLPFTGQQLVAYIEQFFEGFLRRVVLAVIGFFIPGSSSFNQLSSWFTDLLNLLGDPSGLGTGDVILGDLAGIPILGPIVTEVQSVLDGLANGLGLTGVGHTITDVATLLENLALTPGQTLLDAIANALGHSGSGHTLTQLIGYLQAIPASLISGATTIEQLLLDAIANVLGHPGTGHTVAQVEGYLANIPASLISSVFGGSSLGADVKGFMTALGVSFPATFPITFGTSPNTILADLVPLSQFTQLLDGIANIGNVGAPTTNNTVSTALSALQQLRHTIHSDISQAILDGAAGVEGSGSAITPTLQAFPGVNITGITAGSSIVGDVQAVVDGGINALNPYLGGVVGNTVESWEASLSSFLTGMFNSSAGASRPVAGATDVSAAMLAATEAAASLAGQTAAIQAQLPHFYGGSGSSGLFVEVPFTGGVLPSGFVGNPTSALYTTFSAATDSETVSGIWSAIIPLNTLRGLFLRSNVSESTFVYALWQVVGDPGASASGGYYIPNNPGASFTLQIGCNVAGTTTVLANFGPYPLWQYAGNVVIVSWTQIEVGPWYNRQTEYTPNYGPGYNALQGHSMYLASSNNAISLEATADTFTLEYPYAGSLSVTDTTPVSLMGSLYRYAGYIDNGGIPGSMLSWAFYDSGPSAGPSEAYVPTQESTTSTIYTDLTTTTDQVTVTIGSSGLAMVFISAQLVNVTAGDGCIVGFALSGATTQAANLSYSLIYQTASGAGNDQRGNAFLLTGLAPGPTTFKMKYAALNGGTALFSLRRIAVIPL